MCLAHPLSGAAEPLNLRAQPVPLNQEDPTQTVVGELEYRGGLALSAGDQHFGGLSGLDVSSDGARMVAVSDRGFWVTARLVYDDGGSLVGVADGEIHPIRDQAGGRLKRGWRDAEEIARLADGAWAVGFERRHRVWIYPRDETLTSAPAGALTMPPGLDRAPANGGLESLTALTDGHILALTEKAVDEKGRVRGWLLSVGGGASHRLSYAATDGFHPTSLATLEGGDVLALERRFSLIRGFRARLKRIDKAAVAPGAALAGRVLANFEPPLTVGNFEAVAVRRDPSGTTYVYLLSDNNFALLEPTLLMQFRLVE